MSAPQTHVFPAMDGIPNSRLPLAFWRGRLPPGARDGEAACSLFQRSGWQGTWVYTVYPFWHFHTQGHEVLACVSGSATIGFGGDGGITVEVAVGDVAVIPAGVGHKRLKASDKFLMAGGYPSGQAGNIVKPGEMDLDEANGLIRQVPLPSTDPISGKADGVAALWLAANP